MRRLVGAGCARAVCGRSAGGTRVEGGRDACCEQVRGVAELLESAACGRRMRTLSGIDLQILAISIIFGVNFCCVHILLVICAFLHRKNEHLFGRGQFG